VSATAMGRSVQAVTTWILAALLGAGCWFGGRDLLTILDRGVIPGRRGPSLHLADNPLAYWAVFAFFCVALLTAIGFTLFLAYVGWRQATENRRS
jgi:hypothetical protein